MGQLIYKCDESMGSFHWETTAYVSEGKKEVSFIQTWFDGTKVISKQSVIMTVDELRDIMCRVDKA
jgi:hypothetical protein